jgi:hypothetical protein
VIVPFAHAGHVLADLLIYGGPVVIGILAVRYVDRKERKKEDEAPVSSASDQ